MGIKRTGPPNKSMDFVALVEQKLRQITAILAGDSCY